MTASVRIADLDADGVNEIIVGKVEYGKHELGEMFPEAQLIVISGRTGARIKVFEEKGYPSISYEAYIARKK